MHNAYYDYFSKIITHTHPSGVDDCSSSHNGQAGISAYMRGSIVHAERSTLGGNRVTVCADGGEITVLQCMWGRGERHTPVVVNGGVVRVE